MDKRNIILNELPTNFWIYENGKLYNEKTKRFLKGGINKGYHFYSLYFNGKQYIAYTHRLVAEYFIPNSNKLPVVHRKDENKLNNDVNNLEWTTYKENTQKSLKPKTKSTPEFASDLTGFKRFRDSPYFISKEGVIVNSKTMRIIKLEKSGKYLRFTGNYNLDKKHFLVHRVVWEVFNREIPEGFVINHIDNDGNNNNLKNLELVTQAENLSKRGIDYS